MREAGMTQQAIADEAGLSQRAVGKALEQKQGNIEKVLKPKPEVIRMSRDPSRAAPVLRCGLPKNMMPRSSGTKFYSGRKSRPDLTSSQRASLANV